VNAVSSALVFKKASRHFNISTFCRILNGPFAIKASTYGSIAGMSLRNMPLKERPSHWQVSRLLPRNLGDLKMPIQNDVATSVEQPRYLTRGLTSVLRLKVHPHIVASVRVAHITWRLMKHWHFSDALNFNTQIIHRLGNLVQSAVHRQIWKLALPCWSYGLSPPGLGLLEAP